MATDAELLRESRRQPDAYVLVCRRHVSDLAAWLQRQVGSGEAEDLLAETLARGWYARRRFHDPGDGSAGAWLQAIARNVVREYRRRGAIELRGKRRLGLSVAADPSPDEDANTRLAAVTELAELGPSFDSLPKEQRSALELRVVHELDYREIAAQQGVSVETARTRVHRALKTLRLAMNGGRQ